MDVHSLVSVVLLGDSRDLVLDLFGKSLILIDDEILSLFSVGCSFSSSESLGLVFERYGGSYLLGEDSEGRHFEGEPVVEAVLGKGLG